MTLRNHNYQYVAPEIIIRETWEDAGIMSKPFQTQAGRSERTGLARTLP